MSQQLAIEFPKPPDQAGGLVFRPGLGYVCPTCLCELRVDGRRCPTCNGDPFYGLDEAA